MAPQSPSVTGRDRAAGRDAAHVPDDATANRTVQRGGEPTSAPESEAQPSLRRRHYGAADPVTITIEHVITGRTAEVLCDMQLASFEPLETLAIQKQTDSRDDLLHMFASPDFTKVVAWQSGHPIGLGVLTNVLECIPEISPQFLRTRYPQQAARNAIYVGIYVTVAEPHRGITLFSRLSTEMWNIPRACRRRAGVRHVRVQPHHVRGGTGGRTGRQRVPALERVDHRSADLDGRRAARADPRALTRAASALASCW